jgi:hypothetical protein
MKFAETLKHVETLSYYDRPLLEHWVDPTIEQNFLMIWQDETTEFVTWLVVPVTHETLVKVLSKKLDEAITLRNAILTARQVFKVQANQFVYDVTEGQELTPDEIPDELLPRDGSYVDFDVYLEWAGDTSSADEGPITVVGSVSPEAPIVAEEPSEPPPKLAPYVLLNSKPEDERPLTLRPL